MLLRKLVNDKAVLELCMGQAGLVGLLAVFLFGWPKDTPGSSFKIGIPAALICIAGGIAVSVLNTQYLSEFIKHGFVAIPGYNQLRIPYGAAADVWVYGAMAVITAPLLEEFFFRHILLGRISVRIIASLVITKRLRQGLIFLAVVAISALFSLAHRPVLPVFPAYFAASLVYSVSYLKFGLPGAVLAHSAGNAGVLIILSFI